MGSRTPSTKSIPKLLVPMLIIEKDFDIGTYEWELVFASRWWKNDASVSIREPIWESRLHQFPQQLNAGALAGRCDWTHWSVKVRARVKFKVNIWCLTSTVVTFNHFPAINFQGAIWTSNCINTIVRVRVWAIPRRLILSPKLSMARGAPLITWN